MFLRTWPCLESCLGCGSHFLGRSHLLAPGFKHVTKTALFQRTFEKKKYVTTALSIQEFDCSSSGWSFFSPLPTKCSFRCLPYDLVLKISLMCCVFSPSVPYFKTGFLQSETLFPHAFLGAQGKVGLFLGLP